MPYSIGDYRFDVTEFLPDDLFNAITDVRVASPDVVIHEAQTRKRRDTLAGDDGRLTILAADHPARYITKSGDDSLIMGNRQSYLGRILRVITHPDFDGLMATPDIIEEVFIVNHLIKQAGGEGFLDDKVLLGCMNRGGLSGVSFEMDDRFTAYDAEGMAAMRLDGAKLMFRIDPDSPDSGKTIYYCAQAINACNAYGIPAFVEPLPVEKTETGYKIQKTPEAMIKIMGVASALGSSSMGIWLKIPYCDNYELVVKSSTCPLLMLGGASQDDPTPTIREFASGIRAGANVRGALVGRNVHHPSNGDDPLAVALAINSIVHQGYDPEQAIDCLMENRGSDMDRLSRCFG